MDCVRSEFKKELEREQKVYGDCMTPWATEVVDHGKGITKPCNFDQAGKEYKAAMDFWKRLLTDNIQSSCPLYHPMAKFTTAKTCYPEHNSSPFYGQDGHNTIYITIKENRFLNQEEVLLFNFNSFISAVGGSLGLFLGFSILNTLLELFDYVSKLHLKVVSIW